MARTHPDDWPALASTGAAVRERETLERLSTALPADYTVYHAVHWTRIEQGFAVYGEIDFVVVNRRGDLLLIEQKNGLLLETPEGLRRQGGERRVSVALQMARSRETLRSRLGGRSGCLDVRIESLLFCPDFRVRDAVTAGVLPERIVDATQAARLPQLIMNILPPGEDRPAAVQVHRFLQDLIELEPDVARLLGAADALLTRLSGGLARWARRLELPEPRLRVVATAGSGKSQLALAEYRASLERGERPLYVCFNRPLADHFAALAPAGGTIASFHGWCDVRLRARGQAWDYRQPDAFERLAIAAAALEPQPDERTTCLIVDEGQDFTQTWADQLLAWTAPGARCLWLEDPLQNLYGREPVILPGWARLQAPDNHRSPRRVVDWLNALLASEAGLAAITARSPFLGAPVGLLVYDSPQELLPRIREALRRCWSAGFQNSDVALLSYHGRQHSVLLQQEQLGAGARLRRFLGEYDLFGLPVYSEGELLAESVFRFKGQSAPVVVLCEADFSVCDGPALRRLFVGATRARHQLLVVLSRAAFEALPAGCRDD